MLCEWEIQMLIGLSAAAGFIVGVVFYWVIGAGAKNARRLQSDNERLRHVISELSLYKYGPQR